MSEADDSSEWPTEVDVIDAQLWTENEFAAYLGWHQDLAWRRLREPFDDLSEENE